MYVKYVSLFSCLLQLFMKKLLVKCSYWYTREEAAERMVSLFYGNLEYVAHDWWKTGL